MNSKIFIITLIAALASFVTASGSSDQSLAIKRAALQQRMHQRATAGHGALKKRVAVDAGKERIKRAQYHPTRTAAAAPGMEKRQIGVGVGTVPILGQPVIVPCTTIGFINLPVGCTVVKTPAPQPSQGVCQQGNYDGCNPGSAIGGSGGIGGIGGTSTGISQCCQSGYTCTGTGQLGVSICLNVVPAYNIGTLFTGKSFSTQQDLQNYLNYLKAGGNPATYAASNGGAQTGFPPIGAGIGIGF